MGGILDKTVGDVATHPGALASGRVPLDLRWGPGKPGSGVAIDWVTGRSYSRPVQSGLRYGPGEAQKAWCSSSVAARDRGH